MLSSSNKKAILFSKLNFVRKHVVLDNCDLKIHKCHLVQTFKCI